MCNGSPPLWACATHYPPIPIRRDESSSTYRVINLPFLSLSLPRLVPYIVIDDDRGVSTPEKFYKVGSTIELKCIIDKIPSRSNYVLWKHGERMLNYDTSRGGIR